eukprot:m.22320 g.22320  ORF g.22320 m.22320 type:complete len:392 (-) comp7387_c0_seq2:2053-3228(-)
MVFCGYCGAQFADDLRFCTSCGTPNQALKVLPTPTPTPIPPQQTPIASQQVQGNESPYTVENITREAAEQLMTNKPQGTFMVRTSQRGANQRTISIVCGDNQIKHFLVVEQQGHFRLTSGMPSPFFPNFDALIEYYRNTPALHGIRLQQSVSASMAQPSPVTQQILSQQPMTMQPQTPQPVQLPSQKVPNTSSHVACCAQYDATARENGAMFCRACGASFKDASGRSGIPSNPIPKAAPKTTSNGESLSFKKLEGKINSSNKLFDLISLGNDILEAEKEGHLLKGELDKLRQVYRIQRSFLSEGCKRDAWVPNSEAKICQICKVTKFGGTVRRHHCRNCGKCVCKSCSNQKFERSGLRMTKVCTVCYQFLSEVAAGHVKQATIQFADAMKL